MKKDKYIFFWDGVFSQWYPSRFVINNVVYSCAEQYMMAEKARLFKDTGTEHVIMEAETPWRQKELGRQVKNFDKRKWEDVALDIVTAGSYAKFTQSKSLCKHLLQTGDKIIVEASPYDTIWGIGMDELDPDRFDETKWKGRNWLGVAIMNARTRIKKEEEDARVAGI